MKLVLFQSGTEMEPRPGLLTERGVVDISGAVAQSYTPQLTMQGIIDDFERLRPALEAAAANGEAKPADSVLLKLWESRETEIAGINALAAFSLLVKPRVPKPPPWANTNPPKRPKHCLEL